MKNEQGQAKEQAGKKIVVGRRRFFALSMEKLMLLTNLVAVIFMTGIIWVVQIMQYPFFAQVGAENFQKYHILHVYWIAPIVAPMMILELVTSIALVFISPKRLDYKLLWVGLVLTLTVWASTFFLQAPLHEKLSQGFESDAHSFLVRSNWIRTIAWTLHSFLMVYLVWKKMAD